jgi:hypothetical protein
MDIQSESNLMVKYDENKYMNSSQLKNNSEVERDGDHQHDSVDKDKEINVKKLKTFHEVETDE